MRFACEDCRKKFRTEGALEMHDRAKHKGQNIINHRVQPRRKGGIGVIFGSFLGATLAVVVLGGAALVATGTSITEAPALAKAVYQTVAR